MGDTALWDAAVASSRAVHFTAEKSVVRRDPAETGHTPTHHTPDVEAAAGADRARDGDIANTTKPLHEAEWRTTAAERGKASVTSMLTDLADLGFAWRDIARMVGVSVPAVQKWRKGEKASGDSRIRIARSLAACDLITNHYTVDEIGSWFEMPLSSSAPVTPIVLYAANRADLVFELASGHADPEALLSEFEPEWRERYRSDFELFEAGDGKRSIRMQGES